MYFEISLFRGLLYIIIIFYEREKVAIAFFTEFSLEMSLIVPSGGVFKYRTFSFGRFNSDRARARDGAGDSNSI